MPSLLNHPTFCTLLLCLCSSIASAASAFPRHPLPHHKSDTHPHPDDDYYDGDSAATSDEHHLSAGIATTLSCHKTCTDHLSKTFRSAITAPNHNQRFLDVCSHFNATLECMMDPETGCSNQETFDIMTSGIYYLCVEQRKAFEAVIGCIDANAQQVESECDAQCNTKSKMTNWALQSGILDAFMHGSQGGGGGGGGLGGFRRSATGAGGAGGEGEKPVQTHRTLVFNRDEPSMIEAGESESEGEGHVDEDGEDASYGYHPEAGPDAEAEGDDPPPIITKGGSFDGYDLSGLDADRGGSDLLNMPLGFDIPSLGGGGGSGRGDPFGRSSPEMMRAVIKDGCELVSCNLGCIRTKFNLRCQGSAGTLLSEAFVRPIAETHRALGIGQMPPIIQAFMPKQCDFLVDGTGLQEHRIDPKLDEELKRTYGDWPEEEAVGEEGEEGVESEGITSTTTPTPTLPIHKILHAPRAPPRPPPPPPPRTQTKELPQFKSKHHPLPSSPE